MTDVEQPPQNGIDPTAGNDDENSKARPADIEQDMREMERRKRVEAIMGSKLFREELERIVDSAREGGAGASGILQQLSDIVGVPVNRVSNVFKSSSCMVPINDIRGVESMGYAKGEKILRCKLAATFRLLDLYGWTQGLGAQITARLKVDQEYFLVNPYGLLYHEITASSLNKVDMQGNIVEQGTTNFGVNKSHFILHSVVHAARPDIRCAIYIGCSPVVAISSLKSGLLALTKDACVLGEISTHAYTGLFDEEERNRLVRSLGPNSKVILLANHGALCCGETIEEAFYAACHIVQACETQLKLLPVGIDNLVLIPEESRKHIYEQSRRPPEDLEKKFAAVTTDEDGAVAAASKEEVPPKIGSPPKWRVGGAEFEALMRMLDNAGYRTGYIYRHPLIKSDPPKPKNDVELPPAVSSLGYLLEEEELFRQGIWKKGDFRKGGDRSRWLNSPNVYQKVEVLETGTPDPKKITKWVAEGSPTHSTPVRIEDPLQFVPAGTTTKEFKRVQQQIKDNRRADKISAGPQSHILEGVTWDEANRIKDATVSQAGDHVVLMGAASKGIIQRGFQHNATVYKAPYAKNPFDNVTDDELNEYKRTVERKKKSIHGEYTDTDFSESEALNSMQAAGAHAHAKHAQSEPETEHQVIQIQTQQAPIPSQAEVVLSDATLSFINGERSHTATNRKPPTGREVLVHEYDDNMMIYEELDMDNQNQNQTRNQHQSSTSASTTSKCRRDLFPAFSQGFNPKPSSSCSSSHSNPLPSLVQGVPNLAQRSPPLIVQGEIYTYAFSSGAPAASLGHCCQPQVCSVLLHALPSEYLYYAGTNRRRSSGTSSSGTGHSHSNFVSQLSNGLPPPYRTVSHFGFNSPRQPPRMEHKHLPTGTAEYIRYRAMHRGISYEEIFASPRYEQLCQPCFEQLLRLKPELQRRSAATSNSSGDEHAEDIVSYVSGSVTPQRLATLTELHDENEYEEIRDRSRCDVGTQTDELKQLNNFLSQIDRLNYSQESANLNYVPGQQSSPAESATSTVYLKSCPEPRTNVTEVFNFGNWQEQQEQETQLPLTEHHITLEINQEFNAEEQQQMERQLMSREERQRRKSEFEELWQDHVEYYGAKEEIQETEEDKTLSNTIVYCTLPMAQQAETLNSYENSTQDQSEDETSHNQEFLPQIIQNFEQSLNAASENFEKLMVAAKKLQTEEYVESPKEDESLDSGSLFRAIDLENIPDADETASILEPERVILPAFSSSDEDDDEHRVVLEDEPHDEKRDDEKPVTPSPEPIGKEKDFVEYNHIDEKDVDENEYVNNNMEPLKDLSIPKIVIDDTSQGDLLPSSSMFSPLEREILERIQTDRLIERESIFGRIDESIRNKLTPCRMQCMEQGDVEESFSTRTHIFKTPTGPSKEGIDAVTPHLFQFNSEPRPSAYSMHNIASSTSSDAAHLRVVTSRSSRRSRSCSTSNRRSHSSSSSPTMSLTGSKSSLNRTISSTTFVARSSPRKKRNFILENIRNVCRQRPPSRTQKPIHINTRDAATICAFQPDQGKFSTRLWVSLPTPPHNTIGHKRQSGSAVNTPSISSCSGSAKRRRQIDGGLSQTLSNKTFVPSALTQEVSSDTYQLETELTSSDDVQPEEEDEVEEKRNNTNNSVYFSANDSGTTDTPSSLSFQEKISRISGGGTISSEDVVISEELPNPSQIGLTNNDQSVEDEIESNSQSNAESNNEGNPPIPLIASTENDNDSSPSVVCETSLSIVEEIKDKDQINRIKNSCSEMIHQEYSADRAEENNEDIATSIKDGTSVCNLESPSSVVGTNESSVAQDRREENDGDDARKYLENNSSDYALNATKACIDLHTKPSVTSTTSYDSNEFLLATEDNIHIPEKNESEDDDKPVTSKAAARRNRRRLRNSKSSSGGKSDSKDSVVIKTKCTVRDGTLHLKDESLDDIHPPRFGMKPYNDPFLPLYEIEILAEESDEEFDELDDLLPFDLDLVEQLPDAAEIEQLPLELNDSSDKLNQLSPIIVDLPTSDEQILEICQNEENQAKDTAP